MKLSNDTLLILKNFSTINPGIYFRKGNILKTVSPQKNILVEAQILETFPVSFGIYDLNNFLSVLSLYKDGIELGFNDKHVIIKGMEGRSKIQYRFTEPSMIVTTDKTITLPSVDVKFILTQKDLECIMKTSNVLNSPNIAIVNNGNKVFVESFNSLDDSAHIHSIILNDIEIGDIQYKLIFKKDNLKLLLGEYEVEISSSGISQFYDKSRNIKYWVTLEVGSTYNGRKLHE